jgi:hypothetical protein
MQQKQASFASIREWDNEFLSLFPHRYDYICADHPPIGESPTWYTESRHPLSDRLIQQGASLYGVRFGAKTSYCLLDIDVGSMYHPKRDPFAIARIRSALEPIGLVRHVACTSSYSGGIHLYFPFEEPQTSWQMAIALQTVLQNAGFNSALGQLEIFPNVKPYVVDGFPNLYAAHRLPMQTGSYLLNEAWELTYSDQSVFVQRWQLAARCNDVRASVIKQILQVARRQHYGFSGKADKFLNDLNSEIEAGWTGHGQTNYLLGRIAMRSYIFGHVLYAPHPLVGKALIEDIIRVAISLPGYREWCRHQHEIEQRAEDWARCVENSKYFPFRQSKLKLTKSHLDSSDSDVFDQSTDQFVSEMLTWNQKQCQSARGRIRLAIADLLNQECLPATATARFTALVGYGIGGSTLYKHKDLWHPQYLDYSSEHSTSSSTDHSEADFPPDPPTSLTAAMGNCVENAFPIEQLTSLLAVSDRNDRADECFSSLDDEWLVSIDRNVPSSKGSIGENWKTSDLLNSKSSESPKFQESDKKNYLSANASELYSPQSNLQAEVVQGVHHIQQILSEIRERAQAEREAARLRLEQRASAPITTDIAASREELKQRYLQSGDPILMAEAQRWGNIYASRK